MSADSSYPCPPSRPHPLAPYGWDADWDAVFAPYAAQGLLPGRVARVDRGRCDVVTAGGTVRADTEFVVPRDPMKIVCTGDWAAVDPEGHDPRYVRALLPRRTAFVRSTSSKRSEGQVLAANVDHAVLCVPLSAEVDLGRVERLVSLAWTSGARPLLVLTKADLVPDAAGLGHLAEDAAGAAPGVRVLAVSAESGEGVDALAEALTGGPAGGTTALLGPSGAGKSTLANALLGTEAQDVRAVRDRDGKGRHTTTTRNLLPLPAARGGVLIDTPGLRGVGLHEAGAGLQQAFSEIEELARACRFADCAHDSEPGCAIQRAIEDGELPERRLASYRKLEREGRRAAARHDDRLRAVLHKETVNRQKAISRHLRAVYGKDGGRQR